jgi:hypothetical protein
MVVYDRATPGVETITVDSATAIIRWDPTGGVFPARRQRRDLRQRPASISISSCSTGSSAIPPVRFDGTVLSLIRTPRGGTSPPGGTVFFSSPGGIIIGATAVFDVGSLVLTTLDVVDDGAGNFYDPATRGLNFNAGGGFPVSGGRHPAGAQIRALEQNSYVAMVAPTSSMAAGPGERLGRLYRRRAGGVPGQSGPVRHRRRGPAATMRCRSSTPARPAARPAPAPATITPSIWSRCPRTRRSPPSSRAISASIRRSCRRREWRHRALGGRQCGGRRGRSLRRQSPARPPPISRRELRDPRRHRPLRPVRHARTDIRATPSARRQPQFPAGRQPVRRQRDPVRSASGQTINVQGNAVVSAAAFDSHPIRRSST